MSNCAIAAALAFVCIFLLDCIKSMIMVDSKGTCKLTNFTSYHFAVVRAFLGLYTPWTIHVHWPAHTILMS